MAGTFDFPYHRVRNLYPDNSGRVVFGGSYEFSSKPNAPPQRIFVLMFSAMKYFFNTNGTINAATNAQYNYKALRNFYEANQMWDTFVYPHAEFGNLNVKFRKPLQDPEPIEDGNGAMSAFELELFEQP